MVIVLQYLHMEKMLLEGKYIEGDEIKAAEYLKIAADNHHAESMLLYGEMLEKGKGVEIDLKEVAKYYKMSADARNQKAMLKYA